MTHELQAALRAEYELAHDAIRPDGVASVHAGAARKRRRRALAGTAVVAVALAGGVTAWRLAPGDTPSQVAGGSCDRKGVDVALFLTPDSTDEQVVRLDRTLRDSPEVYCLAFETREMAWERFRREFSDAPELVSATRQDAVNASFRFRVAKERDAGTVWQRARDLDGVADYVCPKCRQQPN